MQRKRDESRLTQKGEKYWILKKYIKYITSLTYKRRGINYRERKKMK